MSSEIYIERAVYLGNFIILFETTHGEMRTIDFNPMLRENMGAFGSLRDEAVFRKFYLDSNVLTWDMDLPKENENQINQFDIAPEYIYEHSKPLVLNQGSYNINIAPSR